MKESIRDPLELLGFEKLSIKKAFGEKIQNKTKKDNRQWLNSFNCC